MGSYHGTVTSALPQRVHSVHVARLHRILAAFIGLEWLDSPRVEIDEDSGQLLEDDGCGNPSHISQPEALAALLSSLGPGGGGLLSAIDEATRNGGTYTMTQADGDVVFADRSPDPHLVAKLLPQLECIGVRWPGAVERATAVAEALADAPPQYTTSIGDRVAASHAVSHVSTGSLDRDRFVEIARLRRLLQIFDSIHGTPLNDAVIETRGDTGHLSEKGNGQIVVAAWNATGVVGLAFKSPRKNAKRTEQAASKHKGLEHLPAELEDLARIAGSFGNGAAVDAIWAIGQSSNRSCPLGIRRLESYTWEPSEFMRFACLMNMEIIDTVMHIEQASRGAAYTMTDEDAAAMLARRRLPHPKSAASGLSALEQAGVLWPGLLEKARQEHDKVTAARKLAEAPLQDALLAAAVAGDLPAVQAALAAGADVNCVNHGKHSVKLGATPLWLALFGGHDEIAELLVRANTDVNLCCTNGSRAGGPLLLAAQRGHVGLVRMLLERGADPLPDEWYWGVLRGASERECMLGLGPAVGSFADYAEVTRMLLDAGAPVPPDFACATLRQIVKAGGAPELLKRLVPPPGREE